MGNEDLGPREPLPVADAIALFEPELDSEQRSRLARELPADHHWQTTIAKARATLAVGLAANPGTELTLLAAGRSSQAWSSPAGGQHRVIRVPIPNSGRLLSYRSEALIGQLLAEAGHRVSQWSIEFTDDVECSVGTMLEGTAIDYETEWSAGFVRDLAAVLGDLHQLPATGWGPLQDTSDRLLGTSDSAIAGIVDRWFHASIWPFDESDFNVHPIVALEPSLVAQIVASKDAILAAAGAPYGVLHSDLHQQHLLHIEGVLTGVLDFGDAFIGSTAWDFALLHWYYGAAKAERVAHAYKPGSDLAQRGALLAVAVGCYKIAKTSTDDVARTRLRSLLEGLGTS